MSAVDVAFGAQQTEAQTSRPPVRPPYTMRPLSSDADRAEAVALVIDRARHLSARGIHIPQDHATMFRDPCPNAVGLYDCGPEGEEGLAACFLLDWQPGIRSLDTVEAEPTLNISLVHTAPGRSERVGRLVTLWASDYAARIGARWAHAETSSLHMGSSRTLGRLLFHLETLQWQILGSDYSPDCGRVVRLRLAAGAKSGLDLPINCCVPLQVSVNLAPEEVSSR